VGWLLAALALSCDPAGSNLAGRLEQAERERDRLREEVASRKAENEAHERYIAETTKALNDVQDSIDGVRRDLKVIHVNLGPSPEGGGGESQGQAVLGDIENIRTAVRANLDKLAAVERRYHGSRAEVTFLKSIVRGLQQDVQRQQREVTDLEEKVHRMQEEIAEKDEAIRQRGETISHQQQQINEIEEKERTGYVMMGSVAELLRMDLIEPQRSGFLGLHHRWRLRNDIDRGLLRPVDTEKVRDLPVPAPLRAIEVLSSHPPSSYRLESDGPSASVLRITDQEGFWQFRCLVILIKP